MHGEGALEFLAVEGAAKTRQGATLQQSNMAMENPPFMDLHLWMIFPLKCPFIYMGFPIAMSD